jgi:putative tricarboxylic transport membrane protein
LLPGTGGDVGCIVAYGVAKQVTKNPSRPFGEGAYEGVAAPEVANNAAIGGALTTMLTLGIPGDSVTAIILGSFYLHGLLPGPTFMMTEKHYFYMIATFLAIGTVLAYIFGILGSNLILKLINLPKWFLVPFITILCVVGSYAIHNNIYDVIFMLIFGIIGYVFEKADFPISPIVLAIILGPMIERNLRQALINTGGVVPLLTSLVTRPISLTVLILIIGSYFIQSKVMNSSNNQQA